VTPKGEGNPWTISRTTDGAWQVRGHNMLLKGVSANHVLKRLVNAMEILGVQVLSENQQGPWLKEHRKGWACSGRRFGLLGVKVEQSRAPEGHGHDARVIARPILMGHDPLARQISILPVPQPFSFQINSNTFSKAGEYSSQENITRSRDTDSG
jgi:hypothetical protein